MPRLTRAGLGATLALAALAPAPAAHAQSSPMTAASPAAPAAQAPQGVLDVRLDVRRFVARGRTAQAHGVATAVLTSVNGTRTTVRQKVALTAATKGSCKVLHLFLEELDLKLLGLNARLDKVNLDVTGRRGQGVLGDLFCRLSRGLNARALKADSATLKAINARVAARPLKAFRLQAHIAQQQAPPAANTCQVLDLVLGPLNLELLGLVVDLNKVHLNVTAIRGGGVLGDLFCRLADGG